MKQVTEAPGSCLEICKIERCCKDSSTTKPFIDRDITKHNGFTDEELDFIINYDIKYRMGRGADWGKKVKLLLKFNELES